MGSPLPHGGHIAVIGAGIVGVCCAIELATAGFKVTLFDRDRPGRSGPSRANAGHIADASILPLASPGTLKNIPDLLLSKDSPLSIPLSYRIKILPWLWRFLLACRSSVFHSGISAMRDLNRMLWPATESLYKRAGMKNHLDMCGALFLYESDRSFRAAMSGWSLASEFGVETETVSPSGLGNLEPDLSARFSGAVRAPTWGVVSDPLDIVKGLFEFALSLGVGYRRHEVDRLSLDSHGPAMELDNGESLNTDGVVIAAGAWSKTLLRRLNESVPLEVERGYNITYPNAGVSIRHPLVFADRGMVASQLSGGLRIGGLDELGGLTLPPSGSLFDRVQQTSRALFPDLDVSGGVRWMGHRPSLPDSLPVIGRARNSSRILLAFGHGHYGLTHAPATGRLIADLALGVSSQIDLKPFDIRRFG